MTDTATATAGQSPSPAKLDELMLAMDVVDTLRHREVLVEREMDEEAREAQLVERLRALYKSQGIEVPDSVIQEGVKALKGNRFVYTPPPPGLGRTMAFLWVRRGLIGKTVLGIAALIGIGFGVYEFGVVRPAQRAADEQRIEATETLPRALEAATKTAIAEAQVDTARQRAETLLAAGRAALERGNLAEARQTLAELDQLTATLRQEYTLRIPGRPEDQTGFFRENVRFPTGRGYYLVVDALDSQGRPVKLPIRNEETNQTAALSHFAVRVPYDTYHAAAVDKQRNGILQNAKLAEKRRGYLDPDYLMAVQEGRLTEW